MNPAALPHHPPAALPAQPVNYPPIELPEGSYSVIEISKLLAMTHPANNNVHPEKQLKAYAHVLRAGVRQAVIVSTLTNRIVKGHGAVKAAHLAGWTHWPVQFQTFTDEPAELAFLLADNQIGSLSKRDAGATATILSRIRESCGEKSPVLLTTGYGTGKINAMIERMKAEDPEKPKPSKSIKLTILPAWEESAKTAGKKLPEWIEETLNKTLAI